jgi:hypothetical protein
MAIPRRRADEIPENWILKIGFRLGHGTVDVEGRAMGVEELVLDVVVGS